jgi:hypothetical protein
VGTLVLSLWPVFRCLCACKGARNRGETGEGYGEVAGQEDRPEAAAVLGPFSLSALRATGGLRLVWLRA